MKRLFVMLKSADLVNVICVLGITILSLFFIVVLSYQLRMAKEGDLNLDYRIDAEDLSIMSGNWTGE